MSKYHINDRGEPGRCTASKKPCPLGGADDHYPSIAAAREAYEARQPAFPLETNRHAVADYADSTRLELKRLDREWAMRGASVTEADFALKESIKELDLAHDEGAHPSRIEALTAAVAEASVTLLDREAERELVSDRINAMRDREERGIALEGERAWLKNEVGEAERRMVLAERELELSRANARRPMGRDSAKLAFIDADLKEREYADRMAKMNGLSHRLEVVERELAHITPKALPLTRASVHDLATSATVNAPEQALVSMSQDKGVVNLRMSSMARAKEVEVKFQEQGWVTEYTGDRRGGELIRIHDPKLSSEIFKQSDEFAWSGETNSFSAEASEFGTFPAIGFLMVSQKDGSAVRMVPAREDRDAENEVRYWEFKPQDPSQNWTFTLFND